MYTVTADIVLPTSIVGSLPRPSWYTECLGHRGFVDALVSARFREQYTDALGCYLRDQELAGLDIVTDGDCRFDEEVTGQSWFTYPMRHMTGFEQGDLALMKGAGGVPYPRGHILHDMAETRVYPSISGPVGRGRLQYTEIWKYAQRLTAKPVKFGTITPELLGLTVRDSYYNDPRARIMALSDAINEELHALADAGCRIIQMEEPQVHLLAIRGLSGGPLNAGFMREVFNNTVRGLRAKCEVWCHSCWGNPAQQRMFAQVQSYGPALEEMAKLDADVITFENCASGGIDLEAFGKHIKQQKVAIGVVDHHTLQVERPEEVADMIRRALKHIPAERLVLTSDCGMGREGMTRRHAFYKMVSMVLGTNLVRKERGLPEAECRAADMRYSLLPQ